MNEWLPIQQGIDRWRKINDCTGPPRVVRRGLDAVTGYSYSGAADVELWLVEGEYHRWPGSDNVTALDRQSFGKEHVYSASEAIWGFFASHPVPAQRK